MPRFSNTVLNRYLDPLYPESQSHFTLNPPSGKQVLPTRMQVLTVLATSIISTLSTVYAFNSEKEASLEVKITQSIVIQSLIFSSAFFIYSLCCLNQKTNLIPPSTPVKDLIRQHPLTLIDSSLKNSPARRNLMEAFNQTEMS